MRDGAQFPPLVVLHDGEAYWLAEGFHRFNAAREAELETIACEVRSGSLRDAILHSAGANATHGLRRTNADKRRAVSILLEDPLVASDPETGRLGQTER
jgi:ParB-like chromosome segregation protein Spo0J